MRISKFIEHFFCLLRHKFGFLILILFFINFAAFGQHLTTASSFSILGAAKYPDHFDHFDYVNPQAPKGGLLTLAAIGTYDNFNRYALRGSPAARSGELYDTLFAASHDEVGSYYPLIGQSVTYPDDLKWMDVELNPHARFHDGTPITADDVVFSFNKFMTEGTPQYRVYFKQASVTKLTDNKVHFEFTTPDRAKIMGLVSGLSVLPRHYWQNHNLSEPLTTPPLSSGPYKISDYRIGQYVVYQRVKDYWAADLAVNKGSYNFDYIRYDYYQDSNVAFEAFKAGAYDIQLEANPKNWATKYIGSAFNNGSIIKTELKNHDALDTRWLAFNTTRPQFSDPRVRQALTLAFDFNWLNKAFYYSGYQQPRSFFTNTIYEASMLPDQQELKWLTPLAKYLPPELFTTVYQPPLSDGSGSNRPNLLRARQLLQQAGWQMRGTELVNDKTGQPFKFELLLLSGSPAAYVLPFKHNLAQLGIKLEPREVYDTQYLNRLRNRDYDMIAKNYPAFPYPGPGLTILWGSDYTNSTHNSTGFISPAVDKLLDLIIANQINPQQLVSLGRALDRVLVWQHLMIPLSYSDKYLLAYKAKFAMPAIRPIRVIGINTWWIDPQKSATKDQS